MTGAQERMTYLGDIYEREREWARENERAQTPDEQTVHRPVALF